ncbi:MULTISPECIES: ABC transporter permease [Dictyoglomus]|uniref:ABC transporter permease n=1 Tax=Dictyoglomus TaxID=13 RepID=UPI000CCF6D01|nr:ABC transporter permease [Dictyoglomus turgidum]PNV79989.1 MAG: ABC transporter permease [Dictyoglomus turgidum]
MRNREFIENLILNIISPTISIFIALFFGGIIIYLLGHNPIETYKEVINFALGNPNGWGYVLFNATSFIFAGLAVAVAFKAGLFNIGAEGQILVGGFVSAIAGLYIAPLFPPFLHLFITLLFAAIGGALWAFIPAILKAKLGAHEVINTIMMNWIGYALTNYLVINTFREKGVVYPLPQTAKLPASATLPKLFALFQKVGINIPESNPLNSSLIFAVLAVLFTYYLLWRTKLGYEIRALGLNPHASENAGISSQKIIFVSMLISGALAGLASINDVLGYRYRFLDNFTHGMGFTGIAVALLGKNHPAGIVFSAFLFGALDRMAIGMDVFTHIPREIISVLQAVIILTIVVSNEVLIRFLKRRRKTIYA